MSQTEQETKTWVLELTRNDIFTQREQYSGFFKEMGKLHERLNHVAKGLEADHVFSWRYDSFTSRSTKAISLLGRMDTHIHIDLFMGSDFRVIIMGFNKNDELFKATPEFLLKVAGLLIGKHCKRELKVESYEEFQKRKEEENKE